jgi:hypothetical protein
MSGILTPSQINQPRLVTIDELRAKLLPLTMGYKWGEDAIHDLWKLGAPVPVNPGQPETRVLLPKQFEKWFTDVATRKGLDTTNAYNSVAKTLRTSAGQTTSRPR